MARHIVRSTSKIKTTTIKTTTSSTTTNKPATSTNTSTISTNAYNELLSKFNNYALKSSLTDFITQQELNSAISTIKQCNCEHQTIGSGSVDNNALNALIQKLNNYGIFNYDVPGKETIVTEFFPHLTTSNSGTYHDVFMPYGFDANWQVLMAMAQTNGNSVNDFDFIYIQTPNGKKTINSLSFTKYFRKGPSAVDPALATEHYNYIISKDILNEPVTITTNNGIKSIKIFWAWDELHSAANYTPSNPSDVANYDDGPNEMFVEFVPTTNDTKNGIICTFDGGYGGTGHYIASGTITLTLPENISLVNNLPNGSYTITASGNIITIKLAKEDANGNIMQYYGYFTKQIIIADSATKRYVIKLNGEPEALPPNY